MKKSVLIVTDAFLPRWDGIARFLSDIIPALAKIFSVTVIAPRYGNPPKISHVRIITVPTYNFEINAYSPPQFATKLIEEKVKKADLVFSQSIGPLGGTAILVANKLKVKVVAYVHSVEWELIPKSLPKSHVLRLSSTIVTKSIAKKVYNKANLLLVPSKHTGDTLQKNEIFTKQRIVPMGVDSSKFFPAKDKAEAKGRLHIGKNVFVIGFCGRIAREKDLPTLYRAFLHINKKYPDTMLLIVGSGLIKLQKSLLNKGVRFVGSSDNVLPYLQAMDVFVLPSHTETSSLSTMEAMACGVPVVVTPVGNVKNYVRAGYNGLLFSTKNVNLLVDHIERLLLDKKLRKKLARNARKTIVRSHQWEKTTRKVKEILSKV